MDNIKKAVILLNDADDEFFPLARVIPKELLPLADVPIVQRITEEAIDCGVREVNFILPSGKKAVTDHFKYTDKVPTAQEGFKEKHFPVSFSYLSFKKGVKSNNLISRAKGKIGDEAFALMMSDVVFAGKNSSLHQLSSVFRTSQKPVVALKEVEEEEMHSFNIVEAEKIANRLYKIKKVIENPDPKQTDSRLAIMGRYILTPLVFDYFKDSNIEELMGGALNDLINAGKTVYGYQCEGDWHFIDNKESYISSLKAFLES